MGIGKSHQISKSSLFVLLILSFVSIRAATPRLAQPFIKTNIKPLVQIDTTTLSDGDLIFRKGYDLISRLVLSQGNSPQFSHVGIILKYDDKAKVIHAIPENSNSSSGVISEDLSSFISKESASAIAIYRYTGMNDTLRQKIRDYALKQVGKPFDTDFLLSTDDILYCTELIIKAFQSTGLDITTNLSPIRVMLIDEPVIPPDHLRHLQHLIPVQDRYEPLSVVCGRSTETGQAMNGCR